MSSERHLLVKSCVHVYRLRETSSFSFSFSYPYRINLTIANIIAFNQQGFLLGKAQWATAALPGSLVINYGVDGWQLWIEMGCVSSNLSIQAGQESCLRYEKIRLSENAYSDFS